MVVEDVERRIVKVGARLSQCNGTRGAVNEFSTEFILKGRDLFADSWLTNSSFLGDRGEIPFFNDSDEHVHCIQFVHTSLPIPLWNGCYARNSDSSALLSDVKNTGLNKIHLPRNALRLGIAGIPQTAKSARTSGTSDRQPKSFEQDFSGVGSCQQTVKGDFMSKLANKVALVTGGSRGIGAAVAKRLAADGANVAITYAKDAKAASAVVKAIERAGQRAIAIQADAIDADAVAAAVEKTVATFGRLDGRVNNTGTASTKAFVRYPLEEMGVGHDI